MTQELKNDGSEYLDTIVKSIFNGYEAVNSLVSNLALYLIEKNIIDKDDYLKFTKGTLEQYLENLKSEGHDADSNIVKQVSRQFNMHLNDFKKSE